MKLIDLKEIAVTHKEFDSVTNKVLSTLRSLFNVDELVTLAKDSPYLEDKAKIENAIMRAMERYRDEIDPRTRKNVIQRIKNMLGV